MFGKEPAELPMSELRRLEIEHDHLFMRLAMTGCGAAIALIGSLMTWTRGLTDEAGHISEGGLQGDGRYTAALALALAACAVWFYARPLRTPALCGAAAAAGLLVASITEWNIVSDDVHSVNLSNGMFATAKVSTGLWVLLLGSALAFIGAVWTVRVER
jgi:hypothetical protein